MLAVCSGLGAMSDRRVAGACPDARRQRPHRRRPRPARVISIASTTPLSRRCCGSRRTSTCCSSSPPLASQTGDLEGAISALERMLLINPNLPRVRLELGVLYYRLELLRGGAHLSRRRAEIAQPAGRRAQPGPSSSSRRSRHSSRPSHFHGEVFIGLRYQSNANLGPATSSVRLFGQAANLNQQAARLARLGRRQHGAGAPHLRFRHARTRRRWRPSSPPTPTASSSSVRRQRLADRPDDRPALPGVQRQLRGHDA